MKIKDLNGIVTSQLGGAYAWTMVFSRKTRKSTETATFERISKLYGDLEIVRIIPYCIDGDAVLVIETEEDFDRTE